MNLQDSLLFRQECYIGGEWVNSDSSAASSIADPATGEVLGTVPDMGRNETRRAISAAQEAFACTDRRITATINWLFAILWG